MDISLLKYFALPPDFKLSDVFLDGQQVMQELNIKERTLQHYRTTGKISYSDSLGKIFYFKHEIAKLLLEGRRNHRWLIVQPFNKLHIAITWSISLYTG